ncbi:SCO family protein [Massilia horti]|nr:SCO family protein [Massilia horti]
MLSTTAAADGGTTAAARGAEIYLRGLALQDQDGRPVDLYRDLIAGRSVVIHTFFAGCGDSCPAMMATLRAVQERLGNRLGPEVRLVSITIDPVHDTPAALKAYARKLGAQPGWVFLTGSEQQVGEALRRLGLFVDDPGAHMDTMVAGNMRTGLWKKIHGTAAGARVVDLIMGVADDTGH